MQCWDHVKQTQTDRETEATEAGWVTHTIKHTFLEWITCTYSREYTILDAARERDEEVLGDDYPGFSSLSSCNQMGVIARAGGTNYGPFQQNPIQSVQMQSVLSAEWSLLSLFYSKHSYTLLPGYSTLCTVGKCRSSYSEWFQMILKKKKKHLKDSKELNNAHSGCEFYWNCNIVMVMCDAQWGIVFHYSAWFQKAPIISFYGVCYRVFLRDRTWKCFFFPPMLFLQHSGLVNP